MNARQRQIERFYAAERGQRLHEQIAGQIKGIAPTSIHVDELSGFHALERAMEEATERTGRIGSTALVGAAAFKRLSAELAKATGRAPVAGEKIAQYKGIEIKECSWIGDEDLFLIDESKVTLDEPPGFTWEWMR